MPAPDLWRTAVRGLVPALAEVSDAELLARFHAHRDEAAFELLVYRHGPLVWSACRRLLGDHHAAEDAFQATFLALARQAGSIREGQSVPAWLHRVAVRAGNHLRRRRRALAPLGDDVVDAGRSPVDAADDRETAAHIDAAINRLSDRLRQVFILCELHGYSLADAAARLGVPIGTVASRLGRARERLRKMLTARGLAVGSVAGLAAAEVVPPVLRGASVRMAAGGTKVTPMVMALSRRAAGPPLRMPLIGLACSIAAGFVAVAIALGGPEPPVTPKPPAKDPPLTAAVRKDAEGIPLPDGAVARLGSSRFRFGGTTDSAEFSVFSPDGKLLAFGRDGGVTVLDVASGRPVHWFPTADRQYVQLVRFVADGQRLAVGTTGPKGGLTIYDLAGGKPAGVWALPFKDLRVQFGDITRDGTRVLYQDPGGNRILLWDLAARAAVWSFPHNRVVSALRITDDGKHVVLCSGNGKPELRNARTGQLAGQFPDPGPAFGRWKGVTASPDGRLAVAADTGEAVAVLAASGADRLRLPASKQAAYGFAFSPDGRYLVGLGTQVWDLKEKDNKGPVARLPSANSAAFSPDGKTLALAGDGVVTLWSVGDWKRRPEGPDPATPVRRVWFTPDGKDVLGYTPAGWLSWPAGGGPATRLSDDSPGLPEPRADVSADGRVLANVLAEPTRRDPRKAGDVRIIDRGTGEVRRIPRDADAWEPVRVSPDGKYVSSVIPNQAIRVWDAGTGRVVFEQPRADDYAVLGYQVAPDGRGLALSLRGTWPRVTPARPGEGPSYAAVTVTDQRSGRTRALEPMPWGVYVNGVHFTRDGTRLVLHANYDEGRDGGSVSVWDVRTGRRLMNWKKKSDGYICTFTAAPDARSVLVGESKGTLALVEVATGGERAIFGHRGRVYSAAFAPDGTRAVSSSPEAPIYVWDLLGDPGRWDAMKADAVWADLASSDAKSAYAAVRKLRANPAEAVAFLKDRVKVPVPPSNETVAKWLKGLDAAAFADRERSQRELTAAAGLIRPKLEAARKSASEEAARRLDQVLKAVDEHVTADGLREMRACEVLEGIRSPDAVRVLKSWAGGPAGYRLTVEATESIGRLAE